MFRLGRLSWIALCSVNLWVLPISSRYTNTTTPAAASKRPLSTTTISNSNTTFENSYAQARACNAAEISYSEAKQIRETPVTSIYQTTNWSSWLHTYTATFLDAAQSPLWTTYCDGHPRTLRNFTRTNVVSTQSTVSYTHLTLPTKRIV